MAQKKKTNRKNGAGRLLGRVLLVVLETLLLVVIGLYAVMLVLAHGPSPRAGREFAMTMRETMPALWRSSMITTLAMLINPSPPISIRQRITACPNPLNCVHVS